MKRWMIINEHDANNSFEIEANTAEEAAFEALNELGYGVAEAPKDEDEDDE